MNNDNTDVETHDMMIERLNRYLYLMQEAIYNDNKFIQEWPHKIIMAAYENSIEIMKKTNITSMEGGEIKSTITKENMKNILSDIQFTEWQKAEESDKDIVIEMAHLSIR